MDAKEISEVVKNAKDKSNQTLIDGRNLLQSEFNKTKDLILDLTKHMDAVKESYEIINEEIGKRLM